LSFPYIQATSSHIPENFLLKAQTVLLPNDGILPIASIFTESSKEIFPAEWHFLTKLGPQVSPFPIPIFGVNNKEKKHASFYKVFITKDNNKL
jgi:hypothetical protein